MRNGAENAGRNAQNETACTIAGRAIEVCTAGKRETQSMTQKMQTIDGTQRKRAPNDLRKLRR